MNNKSGMGRMLSYMTVYAQRIMLFFVIFLVAWTIYMSLVSGEAIFTSLKMIPTYVAFLGGIVSMICTMGYIPLLGNGMLSMGATRKEFIVGMLYACALISIEMTVLGFVIQAISTRAVNGETFLYAAMVFGIAIMVNGAGLGVAVLIDRFGRVAYYISVVIIALAAGICGGAGAAIMLNNESGITIPFNVIILIAGLVVFLLGALALNAGFRKKTVNV